MGTILECIGGFATNPGVAMPPAVNIGGASGDGLAPRAFSDPTQCYIEDIWTQEATIGILRYRSARTHDNNQGLRLRVPSASPRSLLADEIEIPAYSLDNVTIELSGGAAETDVVGLLYRYDNWPGMGANLKLWEEISPNIIDYMGLEVPIAAGPALGAWGVGTPLNSAFQNQKAEFSYAILGYEVNLAVASVAIKGADTANYRIGGPGPLEPLETRDWFLRMARKTGKPSIPVIQANNFGTTTVDVMANVANPNVTVTFVCARIPR